MPTDRVRLAGSANFRDRLVCSTLSGRPIRIDDIRSDVRNDNDVGLRDYEANVLRLLDKITNGCKIQIDASGMSLKYTPGVIVGGKRTDHDCGTSRGMGYFLEPLIVLGLFAKNAVEIRLLGITNDDGEMSVDTFRNVTLPMLKKRFGIDNAGASLTIKERGVPPEGGGEVILKTTPLGYRSQAVLREAGEEKRPAAMDWTNEGLVKRVRGVAFTVRIPPQTSNRLVDGARGVLNNFLPDVYIFTDHHAGKDGGRSPGYGISLVAETTEGCVLGSDCASASTQKQRRRKNNSASGGFVGDEGEEGGEKEDAEDGVIVVASTSASSHQKTPEDYGRECAETLVSEIQRGGVCDSSHQPLVLLLLAVGPDHVSHVRVGASLTPRAVHLLRCVRLFFGVTFNIQAEPESGTVFLSCVGCNLRNFAKRAS